MSPLHTVSSWLAALLLLRGVVRGVFAMATRREEMADTFLLFWILVWLILALGMLGPWLVRWLSRPGEDGEALRWRRHWAESIQPFARWGYAGVFPLAMMADSKYPAGFIDYLVTVGGLFRELDSWIGVSLFVILAGHFSPFLAIAPELRVWAGSGFTGFIDAVFFPGSRERKPPFSLKTARGLRLGRQYEKAEREMDRVLADWPHHPEAWTERLRLAFAAEGAEGARAVLAEALRHLRKPQEKEAIFEVWKREMPTEKGDIS